MKPASPVLPSNPDVPEIVIAKNQKPYLPLPAVINTDGMVTTRWKLSWRERLRIFWTGNLYLQVLAFHQPLQPQKPRVDEPYIVAEVQHGLERWPDA